MRYLVVTLFFFNLVFNYKTTIAGQSEVAPTNAPGPSNNAGQSGPDACEMLPDYTCSDAVLNDGTGTVVRNNTEAQQQQIIDESYNSLVRQYQSALTNAENPPSTRDIEIALSASGGTLAPACSEDQRYRNGRLNFGCARFLALFLARKANSDIFDGQGFYDPEASTLQDLDMMVNSGLYTTVYRAHNEALISQQDFTATTQRAEVAFNRTREVMNDFIDSNITNTRTRDQLKNKINSIRFEGVDCSRGGDSTYSLDSTFMANAVYYSEDNTFKFCNGYGVQGLSEYLLIETISHELAHSIDPCRIADGPRLNSFQYSSETPANNEFPFQVLSCLRSEESVQAFDTRTLSVEEQQALLQFHSRNSKGEVQEPEPFCMPRDQINESFCDWVGAEVLARYMQYDRPNATRQQHIDGLASLWRPTCSDRNGLGPSNLGRPGPSNHPATRDRLQRITLAHPTIRRLIDCAPLTEESDIRYCDHRNPFVEPSNDEILPPNSSDIIIEGEHNGVF